MVGVLADDDRSLAMTAAAALSQSEHGRTALRAVAADDDAAPTARSAVAGVLQMLDLRDSERGAR